ncbi:hypothetical protein FHX77_000511 [Bifidobacterium commune]|uniref:hypothetical protein n=1 Tax=Bifidobacterium commune TaxID=1505727 RepID=UPI00117850A9|nr:hypothetical protein [Bifidobacterium commune]MBB2955131.1 hypothetical protein [Bifidobacterium commune]
MAWIEKVACATKNAIPQGMAFQSAKLKAQGIPAVTLNPTPSRQGTFDHEKAQRVNFCVTQPASIKHLSSAEKLN